MGGTKAPAQYDADRCTRIYGDYPCGRAFVMAAIFKPAANFVSGCSVHCGYVRLCDLTGDGCTGNAVYTDRQRDHAGAYSDRRTGRDRLYIGIFSVA